MTMITSMRMNRERVNDQLRKLSANDWCHRIEFDDNGELVPTDNLKYRLATLRGVFESLFCDQSVLVLNETTGLYPMLIKRSGAVSVRANNLNRENCEAMKEIAAFTDTPFEILTQSMVVFENDRIFVDMDYKECHNFVFAQNQIWSLYNAANQSFADIVEACAHYVKDGIVMDWTDAKWANPPDEYNRAAFANALRERFEFVIACNEWLMIAVGKYPVDESPDVSAVN